jgi:hypothetical protein
MLIKRVKDFCIQKTMLKSLKELAAVNGTDEEIFSLDQPEIDRVNLEVRRIYEPSQPKLN